MLIPKRGEKKLKKVFEKYEVKRKDRTYEWKYTSETPEIEDMMTFGQHVNKAWKNIYENNQIEK